MINPLETYEANLLGRDFVIGDMHGAFNAFQNLLKGLNFDKQKDRIFSVGDLVDRGPLSYECLKLIREPWFHSVMSNHESMMIESLNEDWMAHLWIRNGGAWGIEPINIYKSKKDGLKNRLIPSDEEADILDLIELAKNLPFMLTINNKNGLKFHVIHAELPPNTEQDITDKDLEDPNFVREIASLKDCEGGNHILWSRHKFGYFMGHHLHDLEKLKRTVEYYKLNELDNINLSHIISGHTILVRPLTLYGQTNLDTCAYGSEKQNYTWEALTAVCLDTWQFYQATPKEFKLINPVEIIK